MHACGFLYKVTFTKFVLLNCLVSKPTKEIKPRCVDSDSGQSYTPGEAWKVNDCISCFCDPSGLSTCHKLSCPKSKCTNPVHLQGRCCPVCPESFLSGTTILFFFIYAH